MIITRKFLRDQIDFSRKKIKWFRLKDDFSNTPSSLRSDRKADELRMTMILLSEVSCIILSIKIT